MQGGGTMYKILCIDDNSMFSDELSAYLALENTSIDCYSYINSCINYIESGFYSLLIICIDKIIEWQQLIIATRKISNIPIAIIAGNKTPCNEITAFNIGADDFIIKPFEPLVLVSRLQALIRRYIQYSCNIEIENEIIRFQNLIIDVSRRQVLKDDKEISLTKTEFNLLYYFAKHNGQTLTKEQIYMNVWNGEYVVDDRNIITHIQRLRQKIEDNSEYIHTIRGVGYRFSCQK